MKTTSPSVPCPRIELRTLYHHHHHHSAIYMDNKSKVIELILCNEVSKFVLVQATSLWWSLSLKRGATLDFLLHISSNILVIWGIWDLLKKQKYAHLHASCVLHCLLDSSRLEMMMAFISNMYLCSIHLKPPIPDADCTVISCSY